MREAAARAQCQNNLKQLSLAILNYHDSYHALPTATVPQPSLKREERLSWLALIFPFLWEESVARFEFAYPTLGWSDKRNAPWTSRSIKTFQCPAGNIPQPRQDWPNTSYVGITGIGVDAASLPREHKHCGVFGYERRTALEDVQDGTGHTLSILETTWDNGRWAAGGMATVRPIDPDQQPYIGENRPFGIDHRRPTLGSFHFTRQSLLTNAAMLDGSVRILDASIEPRILEALATIAGNERIPDEY